MYQLSITIVFYNNNSEMIKNVIESCIQDLEPEHIYVVDNSTNLKLKFIKSFYNINYLKSDNKGFGNGHNKAIKNFKILDNYKYNLILNPDITFKKNTLKKIMNYLNENPEVGALMPKIVNIDGSLQFARRCLPKPSYLVMKRLFPNSKLAKEYEIQNFEPKKATELIGICGCFLIVKLEVIKKINLFDERFFMYFEDFDLARRISLLSKVIYYPLEQVTHEAHREHKKSIKVFYFLISSAIKYFIKWGIIDHYRDKTNKQLFDKIKKQTRIRK